MEEDFFYSCPLVINGYQPVEKLTSQGIIGKLNSRLIFLRRLS
jgi:hypothetical protein